MTTLPTAGVHLPKGTWTGEADTLTLDYEGRFLRRKRLTTDSGRGFVIDLAQTTSLAHGDALRLTDASLVEIVAAPEPVLVVTGADLPRLAWHIGNRHTPCQIGEGELVIRRDAVIGHMLDHLGATLTEAERPFDPEGGAYGHGRTHAHEHGHSAHDHGGHDHRPHTHYVHTPQQQDAALDHHDHTHTQAH